MQQENSDEVVNLVYPSSVYKTRECPACVLQWSSCYDEAYVTSFAERSVN